MLNCCRKKQYQGFTGNPVGRLAFLKSRLEIRSSSAATKRLLLFISTMAPSGEDNTSYATCHTDGIFFSSMVSGMKLGASVEGSDLRGG